MYRNGDCLGQVVGLKGGLRTTAMGEQRKWSRTGWALSAEPDRTDIERLLLGYKMIDKLNPQTARTWRRHVKSTKSGLIGGLVSSSDDDSEASEEDAEFGTIARGKKGDNRGLRQGGAGLGLSGTRRNQDDDSDFDL